MKDPHVLRWVSKTAIRDTPITIAERPGTVIEMRSRSWAD